MVHRMTRQDGNAVIDIDASGALSEDEEEPNEIEDRPKKKGSRAFAMTTF